MLPTIYEEEDNCLQQEEVFSNFVHNSSCEGNWGQSVSRSSNSSNEATTEYYCWCCWEGSLEPLTNPLIRACWGCKDPDLQFVHQSCIDTFINSLPSGSPHQLHQQQQQHGLIPPEEVQSGDSDRASLKWFGIFRWPSISWNSTLWQPSVLTPLPSHLYAKLVKTHSLHLSKRTQLTPPTSTCVTHSLTLSHDHHLTKTPLSFTRPVPFRTQQQIYNPLSATSGHQCSRCTHPYHTQLIPVPFTFILSNCKATRRELCFLLTWFIFMTLYMLVLCMVTTHIAISNSHLKSSMASTFNTPPAIPTQIFPTTWVTHDPTTPPPQPHSDNVHEFAPPSADILGNSLNPSTLTPPPPPSDLDNIESIVDTHPPTAPTSSTSLKPPSVDASKRKLVVMFVAGIPGWFVVLVKLAHILLAAWVLSFVWFATSVFKIIWRATRFGVVSVMDVRICKNLLNREEKRVFCDDDVLV